MNINKRFILLSVFALIFINVHIDIKAQNWPSFRGPGGRGVADGFPVRTLWNADSTVGKIEGVSWRTNIPGLSHSSPIVFGDRIFLTTAIADEGEALLKIGAGGKPTAADDNGVQSWIVLCYNKLTGSELWRKTAHKGIPRASRHVKATHANTTLATDGRHLVAFFGSEGLYCYNLGGELLWKRDLGFIDISKYGIGWGYASSPAIHQDRIALVCDDPNNPFVVVLRLSDGKELLRVSRLGISERSWGTPLIHTSSRRTQLVVNGWPWIVSYELETGKEIWKIKGGGDNPVPTPFETNGLIYITSAHGKQAPIFAVRPEARGDITPVGNESASDGIVWSRLRDGSYMSTPVVYRGYIYLANTNGLVRCFNSKTGEKVFQKRLGATATITASLIAAEGKIYCASENGTVYVLAAGPDFNIIAKNAIGEACFATPAISQGMLYLRTTKSLMAIK